MPDIHDPKYDVLASLSNGGGFQLQGNTGIAQNSVNNDPFANQFSLSNVP